MIRKVKQLTEKYFFDTDCLSAFLWVREESILAQLYAGRIVLPTQVYNELQRVPHFLARINMLKSNGALSVESMEADSVEYKDYLQMTTSPESGMRIIGRGEAAGIAMAKQRNGTLASNNLRDVLSYVEKYDISHITTGDILIEAMDAGIITVRRWIRDGKLIADQSSRKGGNYVTEAELQKFLRNTPKYAALAGSIAAAAVPVVGLPIAIGGLVGGILGMIDIDSKSKEMQIDPGDVIKAVEKNIEQCHNNISRKRETISQLENEILIEEQQIEALKVTLDQVRTHLITE